ncbi:MAG: ABC transporter ATP-binding protein [Bifidobacterium tibiigranuli]|jgi:putative ABC transport system ATP-binding protein|uniref:ABC transporter ATP-binding protein n=1 Tax=Bifidobacterium tibiigranuli TaxID=2172043 RepID=UPI0026EE0D1D|nr:ABC transporter ATP-binding protein [Bifidobacterium tibiigranuli]MCI1673511.1 ABC transporter ATP-binding protein [Bifidobacterium tibiigranuli]MCI1712811.1 ABC transporter ATP-binding protein [Bifidobacterium tibiigranuli]MCI1833486.1 ABC transporter ATP-binding protein [Bifidobacterium tibiigranuli]
MTSPSPASPSPASPSPPQPSSAPLLKAENIRKTYRKHKDTIEVLRGVNLEVLPGEFVAIVGKSGSGKSTLLYCLCGLAQADSGSISLCGEPLDAQNANHLARLRRDHVGFIFQDLNLVSALNVADNVLLPSKMAHKPASRAQIGDMLRHVGLGGMEHERPDNLSGGQRQRVAVARALLRQPEILFADEPTGSLDPATAKSVMQLMRAGVTPRSSLIMVTHDLDLAATADRVIVLADGVNHATLRHPTSEQLFELMQQAS